MASEAKFNATTAGQLQRLPLQRLRERKPWRGLTALGLLCTLWAGYFLTGKSVHLTLNNGRSLQIRTHQTTVAAIIRDLELPLKPEDIVQPAFETELSAGDRLTLHLARPVMIEADGRTWHILSHQKTVAGALAEIDLNVNARDEIFIDDRQVTVEAELPQPQPALIDDIAGRLFAATRSREAVAASRPEETRIAVYRSIPVILYDGLARSTFYTARPTIGAALAEQGVRLFSADRVRPDLDTPLSPGMHVYLERSQPVTILADGNIVQTRTHLKTVGELLAQEGFILVGQDYAVPALDQEISADDLIEIVRVRETLEITEEFIPFETEWIADETLELDRQQVRQQGVTGVIKTRTRVRYENEQEIGRAVEDEWLDEAPANRVVAYGTKVVVRTLETADGPIEYWRKIPMLTTAYNAASSGKPLNHPRYGITRSGLPAGYGIVAVDPKVVPLRSQVYVPGYGVAVAGDTGGSILGKHIDLGFDDDVPLPFIYEWRDVYVLTPVPRADRIRYVLPQWPQR